MPSILRRLASSLSLYSSRVQPVAERAETAPNIQSGFFTVATLPLIPAPVETVTDGGGIDE